MSKGTHWVKGAVIYQIFPDRFAKDPSVATGAEFEPWLAPETEYGFKGGNLKGAEQKLDWLQKLGVTAVYFTPVFTSAASHRYHTHDYFSVDPLLGGTPALDSFIKAAHRRGLRVILDGVFNHASRGFFQFNHLLENGAASPYRHWFKPLGFPLKAYNLGPGERPNYHSWWGLPALPKFNTRNPAVRKFIMEVAAYWLRRGIDGWRLDVPQEINDDSFWREFRRVCKKINPGCYLTGEIWGEARRWLKGDQFDAVMNYQLSAACIEYFGGEKIRLSHSYAGKKLRAVSQKAFIKKIEKLLGLYAWPATLVQMNMLTSHDTDRMSDTYGHDAARVRLAVVFSYLFPGAVNLYYGEELGLRGRLNAGARRGLPWSEKKDWDRDLLKLYRELGALRRGNPVIAEGKFAFLTGRCDGGLLAFERRLGARALICYLNNSGAVRRCPAPAGRLKVARGAALRGGALELAPRGFAIFG